MLKKKVVIERITEDDVSGYFRGFLQKDDERFYGIDISGACIERFFDEKGRVTEEEVTVWLRFDEDIYDTWEHPVNNEITIKVPEDEEWDLDDLSKGLAKEIDNVKEMLVEYQ